MKLFSCKCSFFHSKCLMCAHEIGGLCVRQFSCRTLYLLPCERYVSFFFLALLFLFYGFFFRAVLGLRQNLAEGTGSSHTGTASLTINIRQQDTFARICESTPTHHHHPESIVYIRIHSWCCPFCGSGWSNMPCIHHYSIIQDSFTSLKILCALPVHPKLPPPNLWQPLILFLAPLFCLFQNAVDLES